MTTASVNSGTTCALRMKPSRSRESGPIRDALVAAVTPCTASLSLAQRSPSPRSTWKLCRSFCSECGRHGSTAWL